MDWQKQIVAPTRRTPPKMRIQYPCPSISRFFFMAAFLTVGLGLFYSGGRLLGLEPINWPAPKWTGQLFALLIVSLLLAAIAGLVAFAAGMTIEVKSERASDLIIFVWHFSSCAGMLWPSVLGITMSLVLGREEAKEAIVQFGMERAVTEVVCWGMTIGLAMGVISYVTVFARLPAVLPLVLVFGFALFAAWWQFGAYNIHSFWWIAPGLAAPILVLMVAPGLIARDRRERRLILERVEVGGDG